VTVTGDTKVEADETVTFVLSSPTNATLGRATAVGTITNDDSGGGPPPTPTSPSVSVADVSVAEGNSGISYANFVITLSAPATQPVLVRYTTADRTATVFDRDYMAAVGSVAFAVGETSKTVPVAVTGDTHPEANESFAFTVSSAVGATVARGTAIGTITNDDTAAATGISIADSQVLEGNSGLSLLSFVVSLSSPATDAVAVKFRTVAGVATAGADFAAATGELRFARGGIRQTVNVWVQGDRVAEPNETFTVELFDASGATISRGTANGTILNDDAAAIQALAFAQLATDGSSSSPKRSSAIR
jgi:chitinase